MIKVLFIVQIAHCESQCHCCSHRGSQWTAESSRWSLKYLSSQMWRSPIASSAESPELLHSALCKEQEATWPLHLIQQRANSGARGGICCDIRRQIARSLLNSWSSREAGRVQWAAKSQPAS